MLKATYFAFAVTLVLFTSCSQAQDNVVSETPNEEEVVSNLTPTQERVKEVLIAKIDRLGKGKLSEDQVEKIKAEIKTMEQQSPEMLLPLLSYYQSFNPNHGVHYSHENWDKLSFYQDMETPQSIYHELSYRFCAADENTQFYWSLTALEENGEVRTDKIGGRIALATSEISCIKKLHAKFYLENGSTVLYEIHDDPSCDLEGGFGAAMEYATLYRLSQDELKSVEIIDFGSGKRVMVPVDNPHMKKYFMALMEQVDAGVK